MNIKAQKYKEELQQYKDAISIFIKSNLYKNTIESSFESLNDWSLFYSLTDVKQWFKEKRQNAPIEIINIPLKEVKDWHIDKLTGNIYHVSNDFFVIHGIRVKTTAREVQNGWDQPILEQVGYDGGLLGIIRKRFEGVPHYLCESKLEPGNYGKAQLSPTLQATFANIKKAHKGRKPYFLDIFENSYNNHAIEVIFDAWLAEDGGRLHLKRNRGMLIEVPENFQIEIPNDNFIWLSLYQIKELLKEDAWINPHIRGILAHV
ncbi:NDP-hexose 2,3-dehydratase family protein [Aliarcobacter butzleri]|uniref:NDP-hexose 2,3-dehydratase family protein n=1 Tax=Aliarcobacter butzleri TaxID=28197 RepID=UPI001EDB3945|nr:NDP-hexose 2,3-dehydratase family protein [Aliarcobacter butzleri]MCG3710625.1 NDP-hexose 2,3-dehydratase family protein [Aliarcobacter butzleri]MCG3714114.1 NDP-hexose 2,3-dehydratase family protein [Aliarcobacter butzleri]